jgi:hypothetical protein
MRRAASTVSVALAVVGCNAVSPPPLMPMHAGTAPAERGATTVTLVVGMAGEILGGDGVGVAVRAEHQATEAVSAGVQLGGGRGNEGQLDDKDPKVTRWLVELRGYGRTASPRHDWAAGLASVGLSAMDTGLVAGTLAVGGALSFPNRYAVPALGTFAAVSVPLRRGRPFGHGEPELATTTWWYGASLGLGVPIGATGNTPSIELGLAYGDGGNDSSQLSLSLADSHRF